MTYWLVKSEPESWSWADQVAAGRTHWDGVRNAQALGNMRQMAVGDRVFFYHSGKERAIVGIVEVVKDFYPDPDDEKSGLVDVKTVEPLANPVTLASVKTDGRFDQMALVRQSRLSVMPVTDEHWTWLIKMAQG